MILVTGASGYVGGRLAARLAGEGRAVRALVRDRRRYQAPPGVEVVEGDVTRPPTLDPALAGVARVVHAAAIVGSHREPARGAYELVNRVGTENLVAGAVRAGVERVVLISGLGTRPAPAGTYMATRWGMEEAVRRGGIPFVILQPSVLFGRDAEFVTALASLLRVAPVAPLLGGGGLRFQPLWIEDLLTCLVQALDDRSADGSSLAGRAIPLGGSEQVTFREILAEIGRASGHRRPGIPLPLFAARVQASILAAVMRNPPLTPAAVELFSFENATEIDAVDRTFGFHPAGFTAHLRAHGLD